MLLATLIIVENPCAISLALLKSVTPILPAFTSLSDKSPIVKPKGLNISDILLFNKDAEYWSLNLSEETLSFACIFNFNLPLSECSTVAI